MIRDHEDDLVCDLAETYHVMEYRGLPPEKVAVLAVGLRDDSRVKMKIQNQPVPIDTLLLAGISDRIGLQLWSGSKDGQRNRNRPESIVEKLLQGQKNDNVKAYRSASEFEAEFLRITGGG